MTRKTTQPEVTHTPRMVNPDGSPGLVAPGDMIESAWGNAVSNEFKRTRAWFAQNLTGFAPIGVTTVNLAGMSVPVLLTNGRLYKVSVYLSTVEPILDGGCELNIVDGGGTVLNKFWHFHQDNFVFSMYTEMLVTLPTGNYTFSAQVHNSAGTLTIRGSATQRNFIMVQEISPSF